MSISTACKEVLEGHLSTIVEYCRTEFDPIEAIVLYGGYGRDEGGWFKDERGEWRPYNDYDICLVMRRRLCKKKLRGLESVLAKKIEIRWIDIGQIGLHELSQLKPTILNYDIKYASKVICGDQRILDHIPQIAPKSLPMKEAEVLYFTRLYTLIGSLEENGLQKQLEGEPARFFRNQMAKAISAIVDVLLLAKGAYHASYRQRSELVANLYPQKEELLELARWALQERLLPQAAVMPPQEVRELYQSVRRAYLLEMYCALSLRFKRRVEGPRDVEFCKKWLPISILKRIYQLLVHRNLQGERRIAMQLAQSFVVAAYSSDCEKEYLKHSIGLLRAVDSKLPKEMTWDQARVEAARLRMLV